jgi:UDPglucose--hexose-1-phosphate uridylyltransferase
MRQFRKDPLSDRWVAYAQGRDDRPNEFESNGRRRPDARCPFCAGHELDTPPEIISYSVPHSGQQPGGQPWLVRVVPNKYPAFQPTGHTKVDQHGLYQGAAAVGDHEVIVESPRHVASLGELTDQEVELLFFAYRDRLRGLQQCEGHKYALVFKNVGPQAGASLEHSHSQIIATSMVPPEVAQEMRAAKRLFQCDKACFFCRVLEDERRHGQRFVAETTRFAAVCPYASRMPYEMWVLPRGHASHFETQDEASLAELAKFVRELIRRLESLHGPLAYNYFLHTAPFDTFDLHHYHWHIEILPRLTITAGFEWGAGYYINPVPPEQAAAILRS